MSMRYPGGLIATSPVNARYPSGVWTQAQAAPYQAQNVWTRDQFWPNTTLLLQGDGATNGAQNNTFLDSSSNNFTITRNGNTTQGAFTPYEQDGYWSNFFDGDVDSLQIASNSAFVLDTNFTLEAWVFPTASANQCIIGMIDSGGIANWDLYLLTANTVRIRWLNTSGTIYQVTSTAITLNQWVHVAVTLSGTTLTLYVNGVSAGSTTVAGSARNNSRPIGIGRPGDYAGEYLTGYISNLRYVRGSVVYTSAFTPSTTPLTAITNTALLTCQSNRFRDNSTNNFTLTITGTPSVQSFQPFPGATTYSSTLLGGSAYFDGSGDYLTAPGGSAPTGSGAWTIEFWYYFTASQSDSRILGGGQNTLNLGISSNGGLFYGKSNVGNVFGGSPLPPGINFWTHVVIGKNGSSTYRIWVNGVSQSTGTDSYSYDSGTNFIGGSSSLSFFFTGYLANLRVTNTDVYGVSNTTITVPTSPLTAVSGTQFLMSTTNAGIYDNSMMNNLETVGNAQVSTSVVKYGTGSMAFDGSGDYLAIPSTQNLAFGTGDFTVECWAYWSAIASTGKGIVDLQSTGSFNFYWDGGTYSANKLVVSNRSSDQISYSFLPTAGVWYHLAVSRSGNTMRLFINGVLATSVTDTTNYGAGVASIGGDAGNGSAWSWNGYIDDLRITKGAARYITTFTPPPARLPAQ